MRASFPTQSEMGSEGHISDPNLVAVRDKRTDVMDRGE